MVGVGGGREGGRGVVGEDAALGLGTGSVDATDGVCAGGGWLAAGRRGLW